MASFKFINAMLPEGTTFVFGLWVCVADGADDFRWHLVDDMKLEAPTTTSRYELDEFIDNLDDLLLPDLVGAIEKMSVSDATSTHAAPTVPALKSNSIQSRNPRV